MCVCVCLCLYMCTCVAILLCTIISSFNYARCTGRKKRCGLCQNCKAVDCGKCQFCLDKKKFGGSRHLKKCCIQRQCKLISCRVTSNGEGNKTAKLKLCTAEVLSSIENKIENLSKLHTYALN